MSGRLLRGHVLRAVSLGSAGAIKLAAVQGTPDDQARQLIDDAIGDLMDAVIAAMETVGVDAEEVERQRLYRDLVDYRFTPKRQPGDASQSEVYLND